MVNQAQLLQAKSQIEQLCDEVHPQAILVRLAWHDAGTFDVNGGKDGFACAGANASLRFPKECAHGCNAGLAGAVALLAPIKEQCPAVSWADLMQLASAISIQKCGGPKIDMLYGRLDCPTEEERAVDGILPAGGAPWPNGASGAAEHLRHVFYRQGFTDQEIVALSGAHTIGRAFPNRSGFGKEKTAYTAVPPAGSKTVGGSSWTKDWLKFDNSYYTDMAASIADPELLCLETDSVLFEDPGFKPFAEKYAADQEVFFVDYAAAHKKLSENGAKWGEGGPVALQEA